VLDFLGSTNQARINYVGFTAGADYFLSFGYQPVRALEALPLELSPSELKIWSRRLIWFSVSTLCCLKACFN
jgi:hypothetical protein